MTLTPADLASLRNEMEAAAPRTTFINIPVAQVLALLDTIDDQADELRVAEREITALTEELS